MRRLAILVFFLFLNITAFFVHFGGIGKANSAQLIDKIVAAVNGEIITQRQLDQEIFLIKKVWGLLEDEERLKEIALKRMIQKQILFQEAKKEKITVSSRMVEEAVSNIKRQLSGEDLEKALKERNITLEELRENLEKRLLGERLISYKAEKIEKELRIGEEEIRNFYLDLKRHIEKEEEAKEEVKEFCQEYQEKLKNGFTFKEIRDKIREFLKQEKKRIALREWLEELMSKAEIQIISFDNSPRSEIKEEKDG